MRKMIFAAALIAAAVSSPASATPPLKQCNFMGNWNGMLMAILRGAPLACIYR